MTDWIEEVKARLVRFLKRAYESESTTVIADPEVAKASHEKARKEIERHRKELGRG